jgi:hypothetical protein
MTSPPWADTWQLLSYLGLPFSLALTWHNQEAHGCGGWGIAAGGNAHTGGRRRHLASLRHGLVDDRGGGGGAASRRPQVAGEEARARGGHLARHVSRLGVPPPRCLNLHASVDALQLAAV